MYTKEQQNALDLIYQKVELFFADFPVHAHGFDHAFRVAEHAKKIAKDENPQKVFLSEVMGLLHDIGRVTEHHTPGNTKTHHELSYELLQKWFKEDVLFDIFSLEEKKELLYGLRYHYNDGADLYDTAYILRDADKIDLLGDIGMTRCFEFFGDDEKAVMDDMAKKYYCYYWLRTKVARKIVDENKLMDPVTKFYIPKLREKISEIEL